MELLTLLRLMSEGQASTYSAVEVKQMLDAQAEMIIFLITILKFSSLGIILYAGWNEIHKLGLKEKIKKIEKNQKKS